MPQWLGCYWSTAPPMENPHAVPLTSLYSWARVDGHSTNGSRMDASANPHDRWVSMELIQGIHQEGTSFRRPVVMKIWESDWLGALCLISASVRGDTEQKIKDHRSAAERAAQAARECDARSRHGSRPTPGARTGRGRCRVDGGGSRAQRADRGTKDQRDLCADQWRGHNSTAPAARREPRPPARQDDAHAQRSGVQEHCGGGRAQREIAERRFSLRQNAAMRSAQATMSFVHGGGACAGKAQAIGPICRAPFERIVQGGAAKEARAERRVNKLDCSIGIQQPPPRPAAAAPPAARRPHAAPPSAKRATAAAAFPRAASGSASAAHGRDANVFSLGSPEEKAPPSARH